MRYLRKNSNCICRTTTTVEKKIFLCLTRSNIAKVIPCGNFHPSKRSENPVDVAYKILSSGSGAKLVKSNETNTDYKIIGKDRLILEGRDASNETDPENFVVQKKYHFRSIGVTERKSPKYLKWNEEKLKNGIDKYYAKWGRWLATIFILKDKTTWVIDDMEGNTLARGEVSRDEIELAKSMAAKKFIEIYK